MTKLCYFTSSLLQDSVLQRYISELSLSSKTNLQPTATLTSLQVRDLHLHLHREVYFNISLCFVLPYFVWIVNSHQASGKDEGYCETQMGSWLDMFGPGLIPRSQQPHDNFSRIQNTEIYDASSHPTQNTIQTTQSWSNLRLIMTSAQKRPTAMKLGQELKRVDWS